jgi:hypothetical protein
MKNLFALLGQPYSSRQLKRPQASALVLVQLCSGKAENSSAAKVSDQESLILRVVSSIGWLAALTAILAGCASSKVSDAPTPIPSVTSLSADEIENYAKAVLAIEQSRQVASTEIQQVTNNGTVPDVTCTKADSIAALPSNIQKIAVNYCEKSKEHIETHGLTILKFNGITVTAQSNTELQERIQGELVRLRSSL